MKKIAKVLGWSLAGLLLCAALLFAYLQRADLTVYKPTVERLVSDALGHEFAIGGRFELQVGRLTRLLAEDVTITNADWADDPVLLRVGHLEVVVETLSTVFGPADVHLLAIDDVRVLLAVDGSGGSNWTVPGKETAEQDAEPGFDSNTVVVREASLRRFSFQYVDPSRAAPLRVVVNEFLVRPDSEGMLGLDLDGSINDVALGMTGHIGTLDGLIRRKSVAAQLDISLGQLSVVIDGRMQDLGLMRGTETEVRVRGPEIETLIESLNLPPFATGSFDLDAVVRPDGTMHDLSVTGTIGSATLRVDGTLDDFRHPADFDVDFALSGPESEYIAALFGVRDAFRAAYAVEGSIQRRGPRLTFDETNIRLGKGHARIHGWLESTGAVPDIDLEFQAQGQDLSLFDPFLPVDGLPAEPFDIDGRVRKQGATWTIERLAAAVGAIRMSGDGELAPRGTEHSRIELRATGPQVSAFRELTGLEGLPDAPFDARVDLRAERGGIRLQEARGQFGDIEATLSGWINPNDAFVGTDVTMRISGRSFGDVLPPEFLPDLPRSAFDIEGQAVIDRDNVRIGTFKLRTGDFRAEATGTFRRHTKAPSISADVKLAVSDFAHYFPDTLLERVAGSPLSVAVHVDTRGDEITLRDLRADLGNLNVVADGNATLRAARLQGADVALRVRAPDSRLVASLAALPDLPPGPLAVDAALSVTKTGVVIRSSRTAIGEHGLQLSGELNLDRPYSGNGLTVELSGPDAQAAGRAVGYDLFTAAPYRVFAALNGTATGLSSEDIRMEIGESRASADLDIEIGGTVPRLRASMHAALLDFRPLETRLRATRQEQRDAEGKELSPAPAGERRVFSDTPIETPWLDAAFVDVDLKADQVLVYGRDLTNLVLLAHLEPGRLEVEKFGFEQAGGTAMSALRIERAERGLDVVTSVRIKEAHPILVSAPGQDPATIPEFNIDFDMRGSGRSLAELAGSSNGHGFMFIDQGQILLPRFDLILSDFITTVTRAINPMKSKSPYTELNCSLLDITVVDGMATIQNFAFQSDALRVLSTGTINLGTEQIDIGFQTQPRRGLGVSAGSVANSLLRVGGTLGKPTLALDAAGTAKKTGFAIATAGISLLAKGLFDRLDAEADMCPSLPRDPQAARATP